MSPGGPAADDPGPEVLTFSARALGSALRLIVRLPGHPAPREGAATAWDEVRAEFDAVDRSLSRFRADSELTRLNRLAGSGQVLRASWRLRRALAASDRARRVTAGRFDASVLGALERIGEHGADLLGADPAQSGLAESGLAESGLPRSGLPQAGRTSLVHAPPLPVDLGGIGKGLALRWARDRALAALPAGAGLLLDAGGDLVAGGRSPGGGWLVGIEDPVAPDPAEAEALAVVAVDAGAVATSSVRLRNWRGPDGRPVHHLLDPATGAPARTGLIAVTVAWPDPAWAEVWSKSLFLAGRETIAEEARRRGLAAWWVDDRGSLGMTPDARLRTVWAQEVRQG